MLGPVSVELYDWAIISGHLSSLNWEQLNSVAWNASRRCKLCVECDSKCMLWQCTREPLLDIAVSRSFHLPDDGSLISLNEVVLSSGRIIWNGSTWCTLSTYNNAECNLRRKKKQYSIANRRSCSWYAFHWKTTHVLRCTIHVFLLRVGVLSVLSAFPACRP